MQNQDTERDEARARSVNQRLFVFDLQEGTEMPTAPKQFRASHTPKQSGGKSVSVFERCKLYRTKAWEQLRMEVMVRDLMTCQKCGVIVMRKGDAHVDHITPARDESEVLCSLDNLRLLCASCHSKRTPFGRNV